jgi:tetratricopeptide (TPR) repeat protein
VNMLAQAPGDLWRALTLLGLALAAPVVLYLSWLSGKWFWKDCWLTAAQHFYISAWKWYARGDFAASEDRATRALGIVDRYCPADDARRVNCLLLLQCIAFCTARWPEAEALSRQIVALCSGDEKPEQRASLACRTRDVAIALLAQGRLAEAEEHAARANDLLREIVSEHPDAVPLAEPALCLETLAVITDAAGRAADAEALHQQALEMLEEIAGPWHRDVGVVLANLGFLYLDQGRHAEAEAVLRRAVALWDNVLPPDHPDLAEVYCRLIDVCRALGNHREATAVAARAAEGRPSESVFAAGSEAGYDPHNPFASPRSLDACKPLPPDQALGPITVLGQRGLRVFICPDKFYPAPVRHWSEGCPSCGYRNPQAWRVWLWPALWNNRVTCANCRAKLGVQVPTEWMLLTHIVWSAPWCILLIGVLMAGRMTAAIAMVGAFWVFSLAIGLVERRLWSRLIVLSEPYRGNE